MRITETWRLKNERYALKCEQPTDNNVVVFPPRPVTSRSVELYNFDQDQQYAWASLKTEEAVPFAQGIQGT